MELKKRVERWGEEGTAWLSFSFLTICGWRRRRMGNFPIYNPFYFCCCCCLLAGVWNELEEKNVLSHSTIFFLPLLFSSFFIYLFLISPNPPSRLSYLPHIRNSIWYSCNQLTQFPILYIAFNFRKNHPFLIQLI